MGKLSLSDWKEIEEIIGHEGYEIIPVLAKRYGISREGINKHFREELGIRRRSLRKDKGKRRLISDDVYNYLVSLCVLYKRTSEDAIKDAIYAGVLEGKIENGQIVETALKPNTFRKYLREDDLSRSSLLKKGSFRMVTNAPLEVLQWDSTRATQWFVEEEGEDDTIISFRSELSENKNRSVKRKRSRLSFFVFQDMFSRKVWFKVVSLENTLSFLDFFYEVSSVVGMPRCIYTDNASIFHRSGRVSDLLSKLEIELKTHMPGNPSAKGMVERTIRTLEEKARVTLIEKAKTLSQYNKIVKHIEDEYNNRVHSTTRLTPNSLFYSHYGLVEKRLPPSYSDFRSLMPRYDYRRLRPNLLVDWGGVSYQARDSFSILINYVGKRVRVEEIYSSRDKINMVVEGKEVLAFDISVHGELTRSFGKYRELPLSKRDKLVNDLDNYRSLVGANYSERFSEDFLSYSSFSSASGGDGVGNGVGNGVGSDGGSGDGGDVKARDIASIRGRVVREYDLDGARYYLAKSGVAVRGEVELRLLNLFSDSGKVLESALDSLVRDNIGGIGGVGS